MSTRNTSPLQFQLPNEPLLRLSKTIALAARPEPTDLLASEELAPTCEHCVLLRRLIDVLQLKIKQKDLEFDRLSQEKAELLGIAAHDLRLPIATIQIYGALLAECIGGGASPELIELIGSIQSTSEFALRILEDTLELAVAQSGTSQLHARPAILSSIAARSVAMCRPLAAGKGMHITFVQQGEPRVVLADPGKMNRVFNNLIENAIKYCQPGTEIEVRVSHGPDRVLVSVQDDGPGIPPADLKTLFTPFQRTRARALSEEPSAGLGLSISKRIVDLHGGRIWLRSDHGKGTTFYVSLPIPSQAKRS